MKKTFIILFAMASVAYMACNQKDNVNKGHSTVNSDSTGVPDSVVTGTGGDTTTFTQPIPVDTANMMIQGYLNGRTSGDSSLTSLIVNADTLRQYLNDTSRGKIKQLKLMFAHTQACMHSAAASTNVGYNFGKFTMVIVGYDASGNYIKNAQGMVYDHLQPCPPTCPSGQASNNLISR